MKRRLAPEPRVPSQALARWRVLPYLAVIGALGVLGGIAAKAEWHQEAYLKEPIPQDNAFFGAWAVSVSATRAAIAAPFKDAVYVFARNGSQWVQEVRLKPPAPTVLGFGYGIVNSENVLVVNGGDEKLYIYVRNGTTWMEQDQVRPSRAPFGFSMGLSGETLVVASMNLAYVLVRDKLDWVEQAILLSPSDGADGFFGNNVAISGDTIVVSNISDDSHATGVNGDPSDFSAVDSGAAYVYVRQGKTWTQQVYLKASNTEAKDWFGSSVAISGDTIVIGADREDGGSPGVNGDQSDNSALDSGAAYVFTRVGATWSQQAYLKGPQPMSHDRFGGRSVSAFDNRVVVGASHEEGSGVVHVFRRTSDTWSPETVLRATHGDEADLFGDRTSVFGDTVLVSAPREGSKFGGINSDETDNSLEAAGAAYVFVTTSKGPELSLSASPVGGWIIEVRGVGGKTYDLRRAPTLASEWELIGAQTAPASGVLQFHDSNAPGEAAFYLAVEH